MLLSIQTHNSKTVFEIDYCIFSVNFYREKDFLGLDINIFGASNAGGGLFFYPVRSAFVAAQTLAVREIFPGYFLSLID